MDYYEAQDLFQQMNPNKKVSFEFDDKCQRKYELVYTDGKPNDQHHIENNKVKITVEGQDPVYVPIQPHREVRTWEEIKDLINAKVK